VHSKIIKMLDFLGEYGYELKMPHTRSIGRGIYELRVLGKENIRFFYIFRESRAILFYAIDKKTQKLSKRDMQHITQKCKAVAFD